MNYDVYLFTCLWKHYVPDFDRLPYDKQYDLALLRYRAFESSKYNDPNNGLYECIVNYLTQA
jgi:hypothetical protein